MLPLAHAPAWRLVSALLIAAIVVTTLMPQAQLPVTPENVDKVEHCAAYGLLAIWFTGLVPRGQYWKVAAGLASLGGVLEYLQRAMPLGRSGDILDVVANVVGLAIGVALALAWTGGWALRVETWLRTRRA
jgi:VanZ family protein